MAQLATSNEIFLIKDMNHFLHPAAPCRIEFEGQEYPTLLNAVSALRFQNQIDREKIAELGAMTAAKYGPIPDSEEWRKYALNSVIHIVADRFAIVLSSVDYEKKLKDAMEFLKIGGPWKDVLYINYHCDKIWGKCYCHTCSPSIGYEKSVGLNYIGQCYNSAQKYILTNANLILQYIDKTDNIHNTRCDWCHHSKAKRKEAATGYFLYKIGMSIYRRLFCERHKRVTLTEIKKKGAPSRIYSYDIDTSTNYQTEMKDYTTTTHTKASNYGYANSSYVKNPLVDKKGWRTVVGMFSESSREIAFGEAS